MESICNHQHFSKNKKLQFLIQWKGYAPSDDTWEPADSIHAPDLIREYKQRTPGFHISSDLNNSSHSIILSPHWHPSQPGSLEPNPHHSRHLVPSSFTTPPSPPQPVIPFLQTLLCPWPYTTHKFHKFILGCHTHPTYIHALQHTYFC